MLYNTKIILLFMSFILFTACGSQQNTNQGSEVHGDGLIAFETYDNSGSDASPNPLQNTVGEAENHSANNDDRDFFEEGFELMKNENIGEIYYSMPMKDVIKLLGEPTAMDEPIEWGADGLFHRNVVYSEIGLKINFVERNNEEEVFSFFIDSKVFDGETARGIRIGSKKSDVFEAYLNEIDSGETRDDFIIAGTVYGGIVFGLSDQGEVISIFVGASAD